MKSSVRSRVWNRQVRYETSCSRIAFDRRIRSTRQSDQSRQRVFKTDSKSSQSSIGRQYCRFDFGVKRTASFKFRSDLCGGRLHSQYCAQPNRHSRESIRDIGMALHRTWQAWYLDSLPMSYRKLNMSTEPININSLSSNDKLGKSLEAIKPADLKDVWPQIREAVASMDAPDHVIPEEIYAMCFTNQATLFILKVDGEPVGHAVVRLILPDLHLWQLYGKPGYEVISLFKPDLLELARNVGARSVTFGSSRKAWREVAEKHGFKPRMVIYELVVD